MGPYVCPLSLQQLEWEQKQRFQLANACNSVPLASQPGLCLRTSSLLEQTSSKMLMLLDEALQMTSS